MRNAPPGYECPFCLIAEPFPSSAVTDAVIFVDNKVYAMVPTHHYGGIKGNCLIVTRDHYENMFDVPDYIGRDIFQATRRLAEALQTTFQCEGISTRQHNGPAGNQDVWHYHLHVFPRYPNDGLYAGEKVAYATEERIALAARIRAALM